MFGLTATFKKPRRPPPLLLNQLKPLSLWRSKLPTSDKLVFLEKRGRIPKLMADSITTRVSGGISDEEGIGAIEQEAAAFIGESSEFHSNFAAAGLESTLNNLSKWLMVALCCMVTLLRHDAKALWIVLGAELNVGLSITLKQILNQERPSTLKSDPGMPSSHAQSIFFIVFIVNLSMMEWLGMNGFTITLAGILLALGSYFTWLRVSQRFHTIGQVVVGAVVGSLFSNLWFWLWDAIVLKAFISYLWVRFIVVFGGVGICLVCFFIRYSALGFG